MRVNNERWNTCNIAWELITNDDMYAYAHIFGIETMPSLPMKTF